MKSLKILFIAVALVMALPMVTSCSEDEKETEILEPSNSIVGVWEWSEDEKLKEVFTFYPDGQLSYYFFIDERESSIGGKLIETTNYGTYKLEGSTVIMTWTCLSEGGYYKTETAELYLEQGVLVDRSGGDVFFYYRKSYDVPSLPDRPEDSDTPEEPNTPSNPDQPNTPTNPEEPNNPTIPSAPTTNPLVGTWICETNPVGWSWTFTSDGKLIDITICDGEQYVDEYNYEIINISGNEITTKIVSVRESPYDPTTYETFYMNELYNSFTWIYYPDGPQYDKRVDVYHRQ